MKTSVEELKNISNQLFQMLNSIDILHYRIRRNLREYDEEVNMMYLSNAQGKIREAIEQINNQKELVLSSDTYKKYMESNYL